jgi:pimeloyl-ACP methyl ester carboxylesterase
MDHIYDPARWNLVFGLLVLLCVAAGVVATFALGTSFSVARAEPRQPLVLSRMGVMDVGGHPVSPGDGGSTAPVLQRARVHYLIPAQTRGRYPVVMVPGLKDTSSLYLGSPDGPDGWASYFARAGYAAYVVDEPARVPGPPIDRAERSSAATAAEPAILPGLEVQPSVLVALLERVGPAILIVHTASAKTGLETARQRPDLVKSLIAIEPLGASEAPEDGITPLVETPYLAVLGGEGESRPVVGESETGLQAARRITRAGGVAEVIRLRDQGLMGDSSPIMRDTNPGEIARIVLDWLEAQAAFRPSPPLDA